MADKTSYITLSFGKILYSKVAQLVQLFIPDGYKAVRLEQFMFGTCSIVPEGSDEECAYTGYYWSNEPYIRFYVHDTPAGKEFTRKMRELHGSVEPIKL